MSKYPLDLVQQYYPGAIMFEAQKYWSMSEEQKKKYNVAEVVDNGKYLEVSGGNHGKRKTYLCREEA